MEAQARICPICYDDHEEDRPCEANDLVSAIASRDVEIHRLRREVRPQVDEPQDVTSTFRLPRLEDFRAGILDIVVVALPKGDGSLSTGMALVSAGGEATLVVGEQRPIDGAEFWLRLFAPARKGTSP